MTADGFGISLLANVVFVPLAEAISAGAVATTGKDLTGLTKSLRHTAINKTRQALKARPPAPSTNHDLQRALCLAFHRCGLDWLSTVEARGRHSHGDETPESIAAYTSSARKALYRLDDLAFERTQAFDGLLAKTMMPQVIAAVPEASEELDDLIALTNTLTHVFADWLAEQEGVGKAPELAHNLLFSRAGNTAHEQSAAPVAFGRRVMQEFIEILKSGDYPEATKALEFSILGDLRRDLAQLASNVAGQHGEIDRAFDLVAHQLSALEIQSARAAGQLDQVQDLVTATHELLKIKCGLHLDR